MNPRKGLVGLFILLFFISGISLALLILDEQKDLSSRASQGVAGNLQTAQRIEESLRPTVWDGKVVGLDVQIVYDPSLWSSPSASDTLFTHLTQPTTVRLTPETLDLPTAKLILGPDFTSPQLDGTIIPPVKGWSITSYRFNFFGTTKYVDLWQGSHSLNLLVVMSDVDSRLDVENLVTQITFTTDSGSVQGLSTSDDSARLAALVRPSVVMIVNHFCTQVIFDTRTYPFCLAQGGSGFFVNPNGYIGTNGHVVTSPLATSLYLGVVSGSLDRLLEDFLRSYLSIQTGAPVDQGVIDSKLQEARSKKETLYQLAGLIKDMYQKNLLRLENSVNRYYVQLSNTPIQVTTSGVGVTEGIVPATLIASDYLEPDPTTGFNSSDVAILKVDGANFPALPLGSLSDIKVGSDILVVGYPGLVMGSRSPLLDTSANSEPTFTRGVVSAFKQARGDRKNLIQTDASINHGNSGGPAVSATGQVVGIATYGIDPVNGGGNYNFLRDITDLKSLMDQNSLTNDTGDTFNHWKRGLDNYWHSYFRYASSDFQKVVDTYPLHPTVRTYLNDSVAKTGTVADKTPLLSYSDRRLLINITGGLMAFSLVMIIVLSIFGYIDKKRRNTPIIIPSR